jgi:uncharacterized membrane protein (Fun14 family)
MGSISVSSDVEETFPMTDNAGSRRVAMAVAEMPSWKKRLLMLTLTAGLVGGGAKVATMFTERASDRAATTQGVSVSATPPATSAGSQPGNSSGFVGSQSTGANAGKTDRTQPVATTTEPELSMTAKVSSWVARIGLSVFAGLVIGTIFRMFVKTMAVIAAVAIAAIVALSYFKVINVDFTTMKENYDSFAGWAQGQAGKLKDAALAYLPSATSGLAGFVLGLKK